MILFSVHGGMVMLLLRRSIVVITCDIASCCVVFITKKVTTSGLFRKSGPGAFLVVCDQPSPCGFDSADRHDYGRSHSPQRSIFETTSL
jgi:hypothetical protein